jgi:hypothetical protein
MLVSVFINGERHVVQPRMAYERLVGLAGLRGTPSMIVDYGDRKRRPVAPTVGQEIELDEGARVTVVHTGNA